MIKRCISIVLSVFTAFSLSSFAEGNRSVVFNLPQDQDLESDLLQDPQNLDLETKFCGPNEYTLQFSFNQITSLCWLQASQNLINLDYPEAIEVRWSDGRVSLYYPSPFTFDIELSRKHGSQILRAHLRGQGLVTPTVSYVFKIFTSQSGLRFDDVPDRIMGVLPSGQRFSFGSYGF